MGPRERTKKKKGVGHLDLCGLSGLIPAYVECLVGNPLMNHFCAGDLESIQEGNG